MRLIKQPNGDIEAVHDSTALARWAMAAAGLMLALAIYEALNHRIGSDRFIGSLGGCGTFALAGLVLFERSRFVFDSWHRKLVWSQCWMWKRRGGQLDFADIRRADREMALGSNQVNPSWRLVLRTSGEALPMTAGYSPDPGDEGLQMIDEINALLGIPDRKSEHNAGISDAIVELARAGKTMEAIKRLRIERGLSLTDARQAIDRLRG